MYELHKNISIWNYGAYAEGQKQKRLDMLQDAGIPFPDQVYEKLADPSNRVQSKFLRDWKQGGKRVTVGGHNPEVNANRWLRECYDAVKPFFGERVVSSVPEIAKSLADTWGIAVQSCGSDSPEIVSNARQPITRKNFEPDEQWRRLITKAEAFLIHLNLPFPQGKTIRTAMRRLGSEKWWRRQLSVAICRIVDQASRSRHRVNKKNEIYVSDPALKMFQGRLKAARELLDGMLAENDRGQDYTLAELADKSTSNPHIRRTEMMVRLRGVEEYAAQCGFDRVSFITITAPSKYHSHNQRGVQYANWDQSTPRDVNRYLRGVWSRVRSDLDRKGVSYFGMRVTEPHHDGCPHWHLLIFAKRFDVCHVRASIRSYSLEEDGGEKGASKRRCDVRTINPNKGSAVGYLAKYISKSIDGYGFDSTGEDSKDRYGEPVRRSAERIRAWASTWGIRQFQFFGVAPVGPWRELRRVRREAPDPYETARTAVDNAEYAKYLHECARVGFAIYREPWICKETGETTAPYNEYGEVRDIPVRGIFALGEKPLITRLLNWVVLSPEQVRKRLLASAARSGSGAWTCVSNCTLDLFKQPGIVELTEKYLEGVP